MKIIKNDPNASRLTSEGAKKHFYSQISSELKSIQTVASNQELSALALLIQELDDEKESEKSTRDWDIEICLENVEKGLIKEALDRCSGNRTETAKYLGLSFRSLRYRLKKLGIDD